MENEKIQEDKKFPWKIISVAVFITGLIISIFIYLLISISQDDAQRLDKEINERLAIELSNSTCSYQRDSMSTVIEHLSVYEALSLAMVNRDESRKLLRYEPGDIVYLKHDSAKVVIEDIITGGSKFDYYVKYKVLHKDNTLEEVKPELIY